MNPDETIARSNDLRARGSQPYPSGLRARPCQPRLRCLTALESASVGNRRSASPVESALSQFLDLKSRRISTCGKHMGEGVPPSCALAINHDARITRLVTGVTRDLDLRPLRLCVWVWNPMLGPARRKEGRKSRITTHESQVRSSAQGTRHGSAKAQAARPWPRQGETFRRQAGSRARESLQ